MAKSKSPIPATTACALVLICCAPSLAKTIYVDDDANGLNNGSSWRNAYRYLQDALAAATTTETPVEIRVARGIYRPDRTSAEPNGTRDRNAAFPIIDRVTLRGGFAGVTAADPNARDVALYKSILSGDLAGNDAELANALAARDEPTRADNCHHVVGANVPSKQVPTDFTAELDGFVITGGYGLEWKMDWRLQTPPGNCGGGVYLAGTGNSAMTQLTLRGCLFTHNYAEEVGGAIYSRSMGNLAFVDCRFIENGTHCWGGGLCDFNSTVQLTGCRFEHNQSNELGGAITVGSNAVTLTGCTLIDNVASDGGGGIAVQSSPVRCLDCIFKGNVTTRGAGAGVRLMGDVDTYFERCQFIGNRAGDVGGAMLNGGSPSLRNCLFSGNAAMMGGGAICSGYTIMHLITCTAYGNRAPKGRFLMDSTGSTLHSSIDIHNCVVRDGGSDELRIHRNSASITVGYSDVEGGTASIYDPQGSVIWASGNIDRDPCFANPGCWDPNSTPDNPNDDFWVDGDYHLKSQGGRWDPNTGSWVKDDVTSPCIDAGDPNSPVGEEPFPNGGRINMGAYGGTAEASKSYFGEPVCETIMAGDINGDCKVDFADLNILALHWLKQDGSAAIMDYPEEK